MQAFAQKVLSTVTDVIGSHTDPVPLHEPNFDADDEKWVLDCLKSGWVSTAGAHIPEFEKRVCDFTGAKHAIAVVNGTNALHLCLQLGGVQAGDEVLCPSLTFVATANAISYCHATPHFVEAEPEHLGVDPDKLEAYLQNIADIQDGVCINKNTGKPIRALMVMHVFGNPVKLDELAAVCDRWHITLLEDAAEALGSFYKGKHVGRTGKLSALSFNGNKIITTAGGGMILTEDDELGKKAKHLTTTAKLPHPFEFIHDEIGYNYRMPNLNAALGCAQMDKLSGYLQVKRNLAQAYKNAFAPLTDDLSFMSEPEECSSNYWLNAIVLKQPNRALRDDILTLLCDQKIFARPLWRPMHLLDIYKGCPAMDMSVTEQMYDRVICLPSSANIMA